MTTIVAIANNKGGVGKTTSAVNLAHALSLAGLDTLLIDADPQGHATLHVGLDPRALDPERGTLAGVLLGKTTLSAIGVPLRTAGTGRLTLAPAGPTLADAEIHLTRTIGGPCVLRDALGDTAAEAVVIDCPPHFGALTASALVAATGVLIPVQTEALACDGVPAILQAIADTRRINPGLQVLGLLPTLYNAKLAVHREALDELYEGYGGMLMVFDPIPRAAAYPQAARAGQITGQLRPNAPGLSVLRAIAAQVAGGGR